MTANNKQMTPTIIGIFENKKDADDAVAELKMLGVDGINVSDEAGNTKVHVSFSEVTGVRNVLIKRNAKEVHESQDRFA
jgi:hypothetical protein